MLSINVQDTPLHVVVWKGHESSTAEITQLKKRIEDLEALVRSLVISDKQNTIAPLSDISNIHPVSAVTVLEAKPKKSPFFKSTSVPEPIGLSVLTQLNLDGDENKSTAASSVNEAEVFDKLVNEPVPVAVVPAEKRVDLNGMTFVVRKWGEDVVYCEESSGRAFLDPKDAFHEPEKHHIGYWNSEAETVSVRSEEEADEEQQNQLEKEEQEVEEEEQEEEEEGVELEEITYKGKTYYRDGDNQVYQPDEDGEVDTEKPYGVWDEAKQKVLKYSQ